MCDTDYTQRSGVSLSKGGCSTVLQQVNDFKQKKRSNIYIRAAFHETGALRVFECFKMKSSKFFLSLKVSSALHFVYVLCL